MKKMSLCKVAITISLLVINGVILNAQVTVGSNAIPNATLDIVASNPSGANVPEGFIAPRLTGDQIKAKDAAYGTLQNGAIVYATTAVTGAPAGKTKRITASGYYYYDAPNSMWQAFSAAVPVFNVTAVQTGSYVATAANDVILLDWTTSGNTITIPGEAENIPLGKILYISNTGNQEGTMIGVAGLRNNISYGTLIYPRFDYTFIYIGNDTWLNITSY